MEGKPVTQVGETTPGEATSAIPGYERWTCALCGHNQWRKPGRNCQQCSGIEPGVAVGDEVMVLSVGRTMVITKLEFNAPRSRWEFTGDLGGWYPRTDLNLIRRKDGRDTETEGSDDSGLDRPDAAKDGVAGSNENQSGRQPGSTVSEANRGPDAEVGGSGGEADAEGNAGNREDRDVPVGGSEGLVADPESGETPDVESRLAGGNADAPDDKSAWDGDAGGVSPDADAPEGGAEDGDGGSSGKPEGDSGKGEPTSIQSSSPLDPWGKKGKK